MYTNVLYNITPPPYSYEPLGIQLKKIFYLEEGQGYTFYS